MATDTAAAATSSEAGPQAGLPPYTAYSSFKTSLSVMKSIVPHRIDRSIWGNKFSGSVVTQMLTAYRFLGLMNADGLPQQRLRTLVDALDTDAWKSALSEMLEASYAPILALDLSKVTPTQFNERFREAYKAEGETGRKCMTFFMQAAREAGVEISPFLLSGTKPRTAPTRKRSKTAKRESSDVETPADLPPPPPPLMVKSDPVDVLMGIMDMDAMNEAETEAVWTLVKFLKRTKKKADA